MLHLHRKRRFSVSSELIIVRLFLAIAFAIIDTVWAIYMYGLGLSESTVGYVSAGMIILAVTFSVFSTPLLQKFRQSRMLIISLLISIVSYVLIGLFHQLWLFLLLAGVLAIVAMLRIECFDILFRDNTSTKDLNKQEGLLYMILNVGWLIGPLIAGYVLAVSMTSSIFFAAAAFCVIGLIILITVHLKDINKHQVVLDTNMFSNAASFWRYKKTRLPYIMSAGIEVWWALVYVYTPIFMIRQGLSEQYVGLFISAIIVPLVLVEYSVGKWSVHLGFKPFFAMGFGGLALLSLILFFSHNVYIILAIVVLASFFVGMLEPIQDTYFFKNIRKKDEEKFYPFYRTAAYVGSLIGQVVIATVLLFFSNNAAYLTMALMMMVFFFFALRIKW